MVAGKIAPFYGAEYRAEVLFVRDPERIKALGREARGFKEAVW